MPANILQDILTYTLDRATLEAVEAQPGDARLICRLTNGERIAIHLEGVRIIRADREDWPDAIATVQVRTGPSVRAAAWLAFGRQGQTKTQPGGLDALHGKSSHGKSSHGKSSRGEGQAWLDVVETRAKAGTLTFFSLSLRRGASIASLCRSVVILPAAEPVSETAAETAAETAMAIAS